MPSGEFMPSVTGSWSCVTHRVPPGQTCWVCSSVRQQITWTMPPPQAPDIEAEGHKAGQGFLAGLREQEAELTAMMDRLAAKMVESVRRELKPEEPAPQAATATLTVYVSIGNSDDKLTQARWSEFCRHAMFVCRDNANQVFGEWLSEPASQYQNACIAFTIEANLVPYLKKELAYVAKKYEQDSIAWAEAATEFITPADPGLWPAVRAFALTASCPGTSAWGTMTKRTAKWSRT